MTIGFTGTRHGITTPQRRTLTMELAAIAPAAARHGDCVGADSQFHAICSAVLDDYPGCVRPVIHIHPGPESVHSAYTTPLANDVSYAPMSHFARNRVIVDASDALIACPGMMTEQPTGGTWYTIRYARKTGKPIIICWPDGSVTREPGWPKENP